MRNYISCYLVVTILFAASSCDLSKDESGSGATRKTFTDAEFSAMNDDTTGKGFSSLIDSMFTEKQRDEAKVPYFKMDSNEAKQWIRNYDSLKAPHIAHDSLVKRIWLTDDVLFRIYARGKTLKLFVALPPTGADGNRKLTVLLQIKNFKNPLIFEYYDLSRGGSNLKRFTVDGSFCPPPYPCSSDSIWSFKTDL